MSEIKTHIEFRSRMGFVTGKTVNLALKLLKYLDTDPVILSPWDPMGALAR